VPSTSGALPVQPSAFQGLESTVFQQLPKGPETSQPSCVSMAVTALVPVPVCLSSVQFGRVYTKAWHKCKLRKSMDAERGLLAQLRAVLICLKVLTPTCLPISVQAAPSPAALLCWLTSAWQSLRVCCRCAHV